MTGTSGMRTTTGTRRMTEDEGNDHNGDDERIQKGKASQVKTIDREAHPQGNRHNERVGEREARQ
jgi:hypothetical protein